MSDKLPKPVQDALARQAGGEAHPSADLLSAFAEHSLAAGEKQAVVSHLALCADCREVVFLASNAAEERAVREEEALVAAGRRRLEVRPVYAPATPVFAEPKVASSAPERRSRWPLRIVWAVPLAAALLIVFGITTQKRGIGWHPAGQPEATLALKSVPAAPASGPSQQGNPSESARQAAPAPAIHEQVARAAKAGAVPRAGGAPAGSTAAAGKKEEFPSTGTVASSAQAADSLAVTIGGQKLETGAPAVATKSSFAENQTETVLYARPRPAMEKPTMPARGLSARQWRITEDGHLEHLVSAPASGATMAVQQGAQAGLAQNAQSAPQWTRALADQPVTFRVVSVVGNNVWAGGNGGALFHSSDSGQHWSRVALSGETSAVTSIRFDDAQHGTIICESGAQWGTSDGGTSWGRQ